MGVAAILAGPGVVGDVNVGVGVTLALEWGSGSDRPGQPSLLAKYVIKTAIVINKAKAKADNKRRFRLQVNSFPIVTVLVEFAGLGLSR